MYDPYIDIPQRFTIKLRLLDYHLFVGELTQTTQELLCIIFFGG